MHLNIAAQRKCATGRDFPSILKIQATRESSQFIPDQQLCHSGFVANARLSSSTPQLWSSDCKDSSLIHLHSHGSGFLINFTQGPWKSALLPTLALRTRADSAYLRRRWSAELKPDVEESSFLVSSSSFRLKSSSRDVQSVPDDEDSTFSGLVGEDAAVFSAEDQKTSSWLYFTLVLGVVIAVLYVVWLDPQTGYGTAFIDALASINPKHEVVMLELLLIFALVHSGGASLRAAGEKLIGERAYRVLFAGTSLPLAVSAVVYFINHRYDGVQLWQVRTIPGVHEFCWILSFISFLFLYPSTFNLLEVAAVDKPKVHMYETGIMRITRHPQMAGQVMWCLAHTLWIGNSFTLLVSLGLCAHHLFGVWHGDKRLEAKYGEAFQIVKKRTSIIPFAAILDGRQKLPEDYYKEFMRVPYYVLVGFSLGAYLSHPLIQWGCNYLKW